MGPCRSGGLAALVPLIIMLLSSSGVAAGARRPLAPSCNLCTLSLSSVTSTCRPVGGVGWTAVVANNRAGCTVSDVYTATLQAHLSQMPPGQFQTLATQSGVGTFAPGTTTLSGAFCASIPAAA